MKFDDFFTEREDHPISGGKLPDEILPFGTDYDYVSSSFINGFINCGDLIGAFLLNRYRAMDEIFDAPLEFGAIVYQSKRELFIKLRDGVPPFHSDLGKFEDDVLLLKRLKSPDGKISYLFIWCDCDVSDCSIGRFKTELPEEEVVRLFYEYGLQLARHGGHLEDPVSLDLSWFKGWLSF